MSQGGEEPGRADVDRIKRMIPHREPFLFVDEVVDIVRGDRAVGRRRIREEEPHFQGHFPADPIMPGVLLVEGLAQTAGVLVVHSLDMIDQNLMVYFMSVDKCRFRRLVRPGDDVEFHVRILRGRGKIWKFWGETRIDGEICSEAEFSAMIIPPGDRRRSDAGTE